MTCKIIIMFYFFLQFQKKEYFHWQKIVFPQKEFIFTNMRPTTLQKVKHAFWNLMMYMLLSYMYVLIFCFSIFKFFQQPLKKELNFLLENTLFHKLHVSCTYDHIFSVCLIFNSFWPIDDIGMKLYMTFYIYRVLGNLLSCLFHGRLAMYKV